jgi:FtsP/CotA-like multicopper oxidase with cupredoxin domain
MTHPGCNPLARVISLIRMGMLQLVVVVALFVLTSSGVKGIVEEANPPDKPAVEDDSYKYEGRVTPLVQDGTVYDDNGDVMIWRDGTYVYVNLTIDICRYEEHISFNTRCYNGRFLGPTISVRQGDTLVVYLYNDLDAERPFTKEWNELGYPNHTSLHFHGIHASPDEDNPFQEIGPGENTTYIVNIDDSHYPGTHWYHAHYHGSSVYQIFGGMHGAFIIEPKDPDFYPEFIREMREIVIVLSNLKMYAWDNGDWHGFVEYWGFIGDAIELDLEIDYSQHNNTFVVNGKYQPYIDIAVGEWNWLRIINAGASITIPLRFNSTKCEHHVIAVDGVFIEQPIEMSTYYVFPGCRIDVAVRCFEYGNHSIQYWKDPDNIWIYNGVDSGDNNLIFNLEADRIHTGSSLPFEAYEAPQKPDYLQDLREVPTDQIAGRFTIESGFTDVYNDRFGFNGDSWEGSGNTTLFQMELGKVYEITFTTDIAVHPIHVHINHMQVINDTEVEWSIFDTHAMHTPGTWRDTIYAVFERNTTVRVRPTKYTGMALVHCHYVIHADRGMMAEIEIVESLADEDDDDEDTE